MTKPMKLIYLSALIPILVLIGHVAYALSPYQSGYKHGVSDAKLAQQGLGGSDWYITQPGKGFAFHTDAFNKGYVDGFCSIAGSGAGSDANGATFQCP
jgi:hypothetical protein